MTTLTKEVFVEKLKNYEPSESILKCFESKKYLFTIEIA